jgi:hypothetical protein
MKFLLAFLAALGILYLLEVFKSAADKWDRLPPPRPDDRSSIERHKNILSSKE